MKKQQVMDDDLQLLIDEALLVEPGLGQEGPLDFQLVVPQ